MNWARPPQSMTKGKKIVGLSSLPVENAPRQSMELGLLFSAVGLCCLPHQLAIQDAVIQVEPAKPARPSAAGGAMGRRMMRTSGVCVSSSRMRALSSKCLDGTAIV